MNKYTLSHNRKMLLFVTVLFLLMPEITGCRHKKQPSAVTPSNTHVPADIIGTFLKSAMNGDLDKVKQIVRGGLDVNITGEGKRTALMMAAYNGHTDIVNYLLEQGARVNTVDEAGRPALIYAASGPFPETVKVLLDHKADPDIIAKGDGWTALMFAAAEGQLEVVKVLLQYGADPSIREKDGDTAESFARQNGHDAVAGYLSNYVKKKKNRK